MEFKEVKTDSYAIEEAKKFCKNGETLTEKKAIENDGTMVTVICITYAHEKFIAQALDSFLMQKTNFKFKVFVGEDCGSDGTADIVCEYAKRYPDIIVPFIREKNMGAQRNWMDLCCHATSPYLAMCEGDDYWTDEYKLQKQFDYMENNRHTPLCFTKTEVDAPDDWHLKSWYKCMPDGKIYIPDSIPEYKEESTFTVNHICNASIVPHTSTLFFRWNYDLPIPDWYYKGIMGDIPLMLLHLGNGKIGYLPEITSIYRVNEGSIFFNHNREEHFFKTRKDYVRFFSGMLEFAKKYYTNYPLVILENRIKLETANYLKVLLDRKDTDKITEFFAEFPEAGKISLQAYISFYNDSRTLTRLYSWEGYILAVRNKYFRKLIQPIVKITLKLQKAKNKIKGFVKEKIKSIVSCLFYWGYTFQKKDPNLWVFSGFKKTNYMDNSRYFYEYVLENHPEIKAVWMTVSDEVFEKLNNEGKPVVKMRTKECRKILSHAAVAVTDHFKMSDYDTFSGMNDRTKVVSLWHGGGLKTMNNFQLTTVPGVKFSDDILPKDGDSGIQKMKKKLLYIWRAPRRELMEKYLFHVCIGIDNVDEWRTSYNLQDKQLFLNGYPRTAHIVKNAKMEPINHLKILFAPTYRWSVPAENEMIDKMLRAMPKVQEYMERHNGEFVIRLHPHTWRNYQQKIVNALEECENIRCDMSRDVYDDLHTYSMLITDYSSIAYDFLLLDRPLIFLCQDYEDFLKNENALRHDYIENSPGIKAWSWDEAILAIDTYRLDPLKDSSFRREICEIFVTPSVNDEFNSERIVERIKSDIK